MKGYEYTVHEVYSGQRSWKVYACCPAEAIHKIKHYVPGVDAYLYDEQCSDTKYLFTDAVETDDYYPNTSLYPPLESEELPDNVNIEIPNHSPFPYVYNDGDDEE